MVDVVPETDAIIVLRECTSLWQQMKQEEQAQKQKAEVKTKNYN